VAYVECARVDFSGGEHGSMCRMLQPVPLAISVQPSAVPVSLRVPRNGVGHRHRQRKLLAGLKL
jgi:hypothetical protein